MKDYMAMFNEALEVVCDLGIETGEIVEVKLNYRAKNRLGRCTRNNIFFNACQVVSRKFL